MRSGCPVVVAVLVVLLAGASPAGDGSLRAADRALRVARRHLRAAPHDYQSHRRAAVEEVTAALEAVRRAVAYATVPEDEPEPEDGDR